MSVSPPTRYQDSFFQKKPDRELKGLDLFTKKIVGKWHRRKSVLSPWRRIVDDAILQMPLLAELSDGDFNTRVLEARVSVASHPKSVSAEHLAIICEVARRELGLTPYPVQMLSALALIHGYLAEIDTGEGKTLSIALAAAYESWKGEPVHVITANDYLAARDAKTMKAFYNRLQVTVSAVVGETEPQNRHQGYLAMVTYSTAKEVAADFLRDRLLLKEWDRSGQRQHFRKVARVRDSNVQLVQRGLFRALIDEADNGLIDEAVTPLLISQKLSEKDLDKACIAAWEMASELDPEADYEVHVTQKSVEILPWGDDKIDVFTGFPGNSLWECPQRRRQMIQLAIEAKEFFHLGSQYIIENGKIVIVDESTGRPMPDRSWKLGLHQIVEAKEGVELTKPSQTIAQISFQAFFRRYGKLSGATGTASEIADEVWTTYTVPTIRIPRNKPNVAIHQKPRFYATENDKEQAVLLEIQERNKKRQPVLVGTRSVTSSERLGSKLGLRNIENVILNASRLSHEAGVVAQAGAQNTVTIATNMAGRGTDIELGYGVKEIGGLHVIATEPHESRRVDRQLFGRSGRQGDPGSVSRHYSLDDELFERFLPRSIHSFLKKAVNSEGVSLQPALCRIALTHVQKRAEKLSEMRRKQVMESDANLRSSLGFAKP